MLLTGGDRQSPVVRHGTRDTLLVGQTEDLQDLPSTPGLAPPEPVKILWTSSCQLFCSRVCSSGGLIHAGLRAWAAARTSARSARIASAVPKWTDAGVLQSEPGVVVLLVVVVEELLAERAGVLDVLEVVGEGGAVLEGLERRLAAEVVDGCREEKVSEQVAVLTPLGATVTGPRRTAS